nr:uncharacterized protein LOC123764401 isoform X1 [Procambarus clarkii]XP_045608158.1 uncharacterized protein LOC123764401 isoform X1 [Procambarus clarkii]XP_045608159.1 uncharacterized protein LOC123764401 isoform X1 [Procambarus clarkii]XP_045608160.1 uncharacterized protein LOC123764401 isoform X1 [Procambarus clarkii]
MGCHFSRENYCYSLSCCFCVKNRAACYWIGGVGIIWGGFATVVDFISAYLPYQYCQRCLDYKLNGNLSYAGGCINAVQWLLCLLLIHGARKELRWLLVPWLSWMVVSLAMQLVWVFITLPYTPTIRGFASVFQFLWGVHYFIVVKTHYTRLALTFTPPEEPLRPVPPNSPTRKHKRRKRRVNPALQPTIRTLVGAAVKLQCEMTRIRWRHDDPEVIIIPKRWSNEVEQRSLRSGLEEGGGEDDGRGDGGRGDDGRGDDGRGDDGRGDDGRGDDGRGDDGRGDDGRGDDGRGDGAVGEGKEHETEDEQTSKAKISHKKKNKKSRERRQRRAGNPEAENERRRHKKERKQAKQKNEIRSSEGGETEADRGERDEVDSESERGKDTQATGGRHVAGSVGGEALAVLEKDDQGLWTTGQRRESPVKREAAGECTEGYTSVQLGDTQVKWMLHDRKDQMQLSPSQSTSPVKQLLLPEGSSSPTELSDEVFPKTSPSRSLPTQFTESKGMALRGHSSLSEGTERMENLNHFETLGSLSCVEAKAGSYVPLTLHGSSPARNYARRISYKIAIECDTLDTGYDSSEV